MNNTEVKEILETVLTTGGNLEAKDWNKVYKMLADLGSDISPLPSAIGPKLA